MKSAGPGLFSQEYIRELIAKAETEAGATVTHTARQAAPQQQAVQKSAPARTPRPLGPKSRAFIEALNRQEAERAARFQAAVQKALKVTEPAEPKPATRAVRKAKGDPMVAVYDANQRLVGVCPQDSVQMLAQFPAAAPKPPSAAVQSSDARQPPAGTQLPQPGPAAAAAADPSQPPPVPVGPNQLEDDDQLEDEQPDATTAAVAKALREGRLDGLAAELRKRAADGTPREKRDAFDALNTLALLKFGELRTTGGRRMV